MWGDMKVIAIPISIREQSLNDQRKRLDEQGKNRNHPEDICTENAGKLRRIFNYCGVILTLQPPQKPLGIADLRIIFIIRILINCSDAVPGMSLMTYNFDLLQVIIFTCFVFSKFRWASADLLVSCITIISWACFLWDDALCLSTQECEQWGIILYQGYKI